MFFGVFLDIFSPHKGNNGSSSSGTNSNVSNYVSDVDSDCCAIVGSCSCCC